MKMCVCRWRMVKEKRLHSNKIKGCLQGKYNLLCGADLLKISKKKTLT